MIATRGPGADSAINHMVEQIPTTDPRTPVGDILASLAGHRYDSLEAIYVLDDRKHLLGFIPVTELLILSPPFHGR